MKKRKRGWSSLVDRKREGRVLRISEEGRLQAAQATTVKWCTEVKTLFPHGTEVLGKKLVDIECANGFVIP